jgi:hypothetical protein
VLCGSSWKSERWANQHDLSSSILDP